MNSHRSFTLDLLKFVGIIFVFLSHVLSTLEFALRNQSEVFSAILQRFSWFGHGVHFVEFFFVLGGLKAGSLFFRSTSVSVHLRALSPVFFIQFLLSCLAIVLPQGLKEVHPGIWDFFLSVFLLSNWLPPQDQLVPYGWFLCLFVQYWLCAFILLRFFKFKPRILPGLLLLLLLQILSRYLLISKAQSPFFPAYLPLTSPENWEPYYTLLYMNFFGRFLGFGIGFLIGYAWPSAKRIKPLQGGLLFASGLGAFLMALIPADYNPATAADNASSLYLLWHHPLTAIGSGAMIFALLFTDFRQPSFGKLSSPVSFIASRTLFLYMLQVPSLILSLWLIPLIPDLGIGFVPRLIMCGFLFNLVFVLLTEKLFSICVGLLKKQGAAPAP